MSEPMTAERLAEIEARHKRNYANRFRTRIWNTAMQDRAELLAEVKRLRALSDNLLSFGGAASGVIQWAADNGADKPAMRSLLNWFKAIKG